ncbi:galactosyltransferase-related protein [Barnesiella propionica]|uniref:galactosyltransferase-related protein n=1 Tax=Barnesiella propionica TaxID=2981781 RepID=UPI0011C87315|nr:galactosyltransferase-related protein [Barnesiella propionica]MCU6769340.1 galactosyltransferase-related protein [Barnesiella propionica]
MKTYLQDFTFLILIRIDSVQRLENILAVTDYLAKNFHTQIIVLEADRYNNKILQSLLNRNVRYEFIEDKDPILYKTKYFNQLAWNIDTPFFSIWDADMIASKNQIIDAAQQLRDGTADVAYPYSGFCFETSEIIRNLYIVKKDIRILSRNQNKMKQLYDKEHPGGAVMMNTLFFLNNGMENEKYYGWGHDDFDRYYRWKRLKANMYRNPGYLYHLAHPRNLNSSFRNKDHTEISFAELNKTHNSSKEELERDLSKTH